jgi:hypothetical protein
MRTYQHTAITVPDRYHVLYAGHESDASVGSGCRRRFLDWCGFRFSTTLWDVLLIELRDCVVFSVVQTVLWKLDVYCTYGSAHTLSHLNYMESSCILPYRRLCFARFCWVRVMLYYVTLEVQSVRFDSFSILLLTLHILETHEYVPLRRLSFARFWLV